MKTPVKNETQNRIACSGNINGATDASARNNTRTYLYTVLYYKRKNKVHKAKGVSKLDGTLACITSPNDSTTPVVFTLRSTDSGAVVYRGGGRFNKNDIVGANHHGNQDHTGIFGVDETISVGAFEVEILACGEDNTNAINIKNYAKPSLGFNNRSKAIRNRGLRTTRPITGITRKLAPVASFSARKRPYNNLHGNGKEDFGNASSPVDSFSSSLSSASRRRTGPVLPHFNRPTFRCNNNSSDKRGATLLLSSRKPVAIPKKGRNNEKENLFPGAIGIPEVPNSIRKALRPHQKDGVVFLWNCLTGNGQVANLSPHIDANIRSDQFAEVGFSDGDQKNVFGSSSKDHNMDSFCTRKSSSHSPKGCILSDEMGLGKTLMTIATISALHRQNRTSRFVVVCPSSLVNNWEREFDKWLGKVGLPKRVVVKNGGEEGLRLIKTFSAIKPSRLSEVLIISYDLFRTKAAMLKNVKVALLVVDEGHRLKNTSGSLTMTALESLVCEARLCITATPIQNNLGDMYTIVNFVCPGVLGDLATFRKEYERPIKAISSKGITCTPEQVSRGENSRRVLENIIQSLLLRRLQKDILTKVLPPRHVFLLFCRPTSQQRKLYKKVANYDDTEGCKRSGDSSQEALTTLMKLRKICTHPKLLEYQPTNSNDDDAVVGSIDCDESGKLSVIRDIVLQLREKEPTDKVVIVSNFTSTLTVIEDVILKKLGLKFLRLDGSISGADRQSLVDAFNRTHATMNFALTLSSKAGGVGLNLIGANRVIMVDPDWNPATDIQAMARIYREGQKKECFIYRCFTSGTLEEFILQRQIQKGSLATMTMDREEKSIQNGERLIVNELRDWFALNNESCTCDTRKKIGNWPQYDGKESLVSQGCRDSVLMAVAAKEDINNSFLSFVHIVKDDDLKRHQLADNFRSERIGNPSEHNSDKEFEMTKDDELGVNHHYADIANLSSDDEYKVE